MRSTQRGTDLAAGAGLAIVYFALGRLGLALEAVSGFASLVWPPAGVALAALLIGGPRLWPAVAAGAFLVNLSEGAPPAVAAGIAAGNTLAAVVGAGSLRRIPGFRASLDRLRDVIGLIVLAAGLSTMVSASVGVASLLAGGVIPQDLVRLGWGAWWLGDAIGNLVVAPPLLVWSSLRRIRAPLPRLLEAGAVGLAVLAVSWLFFRARPEAWGLAFWQPYMLASVLIWAAIRFHQRGVTTAMLAVSVIAIWSTVQGLGPFSGGDLFERLQSLQTFTAFTAATFLVLGGLTAERARAARERQRILERERQARGQAERRVREEAALRSAAEAVAAKVTVPEVLRQVAESAVRAVEADGAYVTRVDASGTELETVAAAGSLVPVVGARIPYQDSGTGQAIRDGKPLILDDVAASGFRFPPPLSGCSGCAAVVVPLGGGGRTAGALTLLRRAARKPVGGEDVARATAFGGLASLALWKADLLEVAERERQELERVTESRARLMRGFGQDLKNPLGAADGQARLLEAGLLGPLSPPQKDGLVRIRRSLRTALALINDLLELARAEAGQLELRRAPADVARVARDVAEEYRGQAEAAGLTFDLDLPDELPSIWIDAARVAQILANLVSNALKYTPRGGRVRIAVRLRSGPGTPALGRWIAAEVSDTGPGIPADQQESIFQEFTRVRPDTAVGAGLGLAISRSIARLLDGDVTVHSRPGAGTTFTLWLPDSAGPREAAA